MNLRKMIQEQIAKIKEADTYSDAMDRDIDTVALDLLDACEGDLGDTIAINDYFRRNGIKDPNEKKAILKAAGKAAKKKF